MSSLLNMLSGFMGDSNVMEALSGNTRLSADSIGNLLKQALPMLIQKLTKNASTEEGARSLFNAIGQHVTDASAADQIKNADTEDGAKIIGHILGEDKENEINDLAEKTGLSSGDVSSVLSNIAPSLMSNLSSAVTNGVPETNEKEEGGGFLGGLLGKIFGGKDGEDTSGFDGSSLLNLLGAFKQ